MKKRLKNGRKFLLLMKFGCFPVLIVLLFMDIVQAGRVSGQELLDQRVTIEANQTEVRSVLKQIERQTRARFIYSRQVVSASRKVSLRVEGLSLSRALDLLLSPLQITYDVSGKHIVLDKAKQESYVDTQPIPVFPELKVEGRVTDEKGEALPGVSVLIKGTQQGMITDADGRFVIEVPDENAVLVFSFVGHLSQEVPVGKRTSLDISLLMDERALEEVVVVGYGEMKRGELSNSVSSVKGEELAARTAPRIDQALTGKLAGVSVRERSGAPGTSPVVRIRGYSSLSAGNNPLWVIDGMPVDGSSVANLNFNDVESVEVLKDAAAAAIYGSRGSNGVIIVTTKKGNKGKANISFSSFVGFQKPEKLPELMNSAEWADYMKTARNNGWIQQGGKATDGNDLRPGVAYDLDPAWEDLSSLPYYNYYEHLFRNSTTQNYQLSASGGAERIQYFLSADYRQVEGLVRNNNYNRFSFRSNIDAQLTDFIKIGLKFSPSYSIENGVRQDKDGIFEIAQKASPIVRPGDGIYGSSVPVNPYAHSDTYFFERFFNEIQKTRLANFLGNIYTEVDILKDLKFKISLNTSYSERQFDNFLNRVRLNGAAPTGSYSGSKSINYMTDYILQYKRTFNGKHSVNSTVAYSYQKDQSYASAISGTGFPNDKIFTLNAAGTITSASTSQAEWSLVSYLARIGYSYSDKYMFSAIIRRDGSSRFGANSKWGVFPSASVGWRVSEESFLSDVRFLNELKIRGSWGETGNNNIGNYAWQGVLGYSTALIGTNETQWAGIGPSGIPNPDLTWEKTQATDIGIDIGLFNSRLSYTLDYYHNVTRDLLQNVPAPVSSGFTSVLQNVGSVRNKGIEMELTSRNITRRIQWTTSLNFSTNRNKVLKLGDEDTPILQGPFWAANSSLTKVGGPLAGLYFLINDGVYNTQAEIDAGPSWPGSRPGDLIIRDTNGDGVVNNNDRVVIGQPLPTYYFGITNEFKVKNVDLSILIHGAGGNKIFNGSWRTLDNPNTTNNKYKFLTDYWKSPEEPGDGRTPRPSVNPTGASTLPTTRNIYNGDFVRLKNVTIGYNFPSNLIRPIHLSNLRVYVTGENLLLFDQYKVGANPEPDIDNGSATVGGFDYGAYPLAKQLIFGINVTF